MSSDTITWNNRTASYSPHDDGNIVENKKIVWQQEEVIETTIDLDRIIKFQEKQAKLLSSSRHYYPISHVVSRLIFIAGLITTIGFFIGMFNNLVLPVILTISGYGMIRTIGMAAMERAKKYEERN